MTRNHRALVVLAAVLLAAGMWTSFACSNDPAPSRQPSPAIDAESEEAPGMLYETPPSLIHMDQPVYPAEAKKAGVEGLVHVKVMIGRDGKVQDASVARSAGVESLDAAALEAARTCQFEPAKDASGAAVATWAQLPIKFALQ